MSHAFIAIGSNVDPTQNAKRAVAHFAQAQELAAVSTFYRTRPSHGEGPSFINGVIAVAPRDRDPMMLFSRTRELERMLGRRRGADPNAPRPIDLDVVAWPGRVPERLPHPDIERYDFVARPLAELAPRILTRDGRPVGELARTMMPQGMTPLGDLTRELRALIQRTRRMYS